MGESVIELQRVLLGLQLFQVAFLWLHDWVPLGRLNDVAAVRRQDPLPRLVVVTLLQAVPWTVLVALSWRHFAEPYRASLRLWLWVGYGVLFLGELRAWWVPYLLAPDASRAARYKAMFGSTHAFLPRRHGMVPNTLHVLLHAATLATLLVLGALELAGKR
jgi:hypothetical protein